MTPAWYNGCMTTPVVSPPDIAALIAVDAQGVARVAGSRIKVADLVLEHTREGLTPEQIVAAYPHLTLRQVEAGLSYYYAHRAAVEAHIAASEAFADRLHTEAESPFAARMRAEGRLPARDRAE